MMACVSCRSQARRVSENVRTVSATSVNRRCSRVLWKDGTG